MYPHGRARLRLKFVKVLSFLGCNSLEELKFHAGTKRKIVVDVASCKIKSSLLNSDDFNLLSNHGSIIGKMMSWQRFKNKPAGTCLSQRVKSTILYLIMWKMTGFSSI